LLGISRLHSGGGGERDRGKSDRDFGRDLQVRISEEVVGAGVGKKRMRPVSAKAKEGDADLKC